jgi:excisionase family DNA binding protein
MDLGQPLATSIAGAAKLASVCRSKIYDAIRDDKLKSFKLGRRRLIMVADLKAFLDSLREGGAA